MSDGGFCDEREVHWTNFDSTVYARKLLTLKEACEAKRKPVRKKKRKNKGKLNG